MTGLCVLPKDHWLLEDNLRVGGIVARLELDQCGRGYKYLSGYDCWIIRARSRVRACVEHAIGVIKRKFAFSMVRYRSIAKNANRLLVACALANLSIARSRLFRDKEA